MALLFAAGCGGSGSVSAPGPDAATVISLGDAAGPFSEGAAAGDAAVEKPMLDGGFLVGGVVFRADRFVTKAVFTPGDCAGFGIPNMPRIVEGPPVGGGAQMGSIDVVSLGNSGEIVLSFEPNAIVDGEGPDFIVFENAFFAGGDPSKPSAEPGEVSVSDDGVAWTSYPCTATAYPFGACAGWHPVYSSPENGISPVDPKVAGGDAFDLADLGVKMAHFVRIRDKASTACPPNPNKTTTNGFDLDAVAIVNAQMP